MGKNQLPEAQALEELFANLLGRDVNAGEGKAPAVGEADCVVACYRRDDESLGAVAVCDIPFAAYAGACLAMVPAGSAQEMAAAGELNALAIENAHEVLNIIAVALADKEGPPLRLAEVAIGGDALPEDAAEGLGSAVAAFEIEIDGYGKGQLALYLS